MIITVIDRLTVVLLFLVSMPISALPLTWPVQELKNWTNPAGPDHQPYFLIFGGTRMEMQTPNGTRAIPMEELSARQIAAQLAFFLPCLIRSFRWIYRLAGG
jgi:hypothetical protein